jgi:hypothetical protein
MKKIALLLIAFLFTAGLKAHVVTWWENPLAAEFDPPALRLDPLYDESLDLLDFPVPLDLPPFRTFTVLPEFFEPCLVSVTINPPKEPFLGIRISENPAQVVVVAVYLKDQPPRDHVETEITGEWHATGEPQDRGCNGSNTFTVPMDISLIPLPFDIFFDPEAETVNIDTREQVGLQESSDVTGGWITRGIGQIFSVKPDDHAAFYRPTKRIGGGVLGAVTDPAGKPQSGASVDLADKGRNTPVDNGGNFIMKSLPFGDNLLQIIKTFLVTDPVTGERGTNLATFDILVPIVKAYGTLNFKVEMQAFTIPLCNCSPWCSIGFGTLDGVNTPIYFSGGANPPKGGPASCGAVEVTVTGPDGSTFQLKAGKGKHQNSGANPMPGTWKVTTKVCGQEKTCSITYP